ncbi:MAG: hypothetical protein ACOX17_03780 [Christensenellales bacterium]|jgi:uncharacterized membrane protein
MKRILPWVQWIAFVILLTDWAVIGIQLLNGNYDVLAGGYVALISLLVFVVSLIIRALINKCTYCGKIRMSQGEYCSHCGRKPE